ncbi:hypothetical protein GCM10023086_77270 [Streptomyces venetus]|uniref:Uncharacterized protein n=1 Tax=Streptomyces venetus TaxID=1701086 RepID=A0ABP8HMA4_9ACTN
MLRSLRSRNRACVPRLSLRFSRVGGPLRSPPLWSFRLRLQDHYGPLTRAGAGCRELWWVPRLNGLR